MVFTGLLTVTNEKGEIRVCALVATKSHSQFELALKNMKKSLELYGHSMPSVFFTDNVAQDRSFLESVFPSLRDGIIPVEKYSNLNPLTLPENIIVRTMDTAAGIDDAVRTILESLPADGNGSIVVGFDTECNVNVSPTGQVAGRGLTAIIQIAHENCVFVFKVWL
jgi:enamine deaminase RidA (YjgF/YER057c/UK114 family)